MGVWGWHQIPPGKWAQRTGEVLAVWDRSVLGSGVLRCWGVHVWLLLCGWGGREEGLKGNGIALLNTHSHMHSDLLV